MTFCIAMPGVRRWINAGLFSLGWMVACAAQAGTDPWTLSGTLVASDGAANDFLGRSVAIDGDTAVVGAGGSDVGGNDSQGAAYVYVRSGGAWTQQIKLTASDGAAADEFGFAVSISGDTIIVGSRFVNADGINGRGAAYVYVRSGTTWNEQAKLMADDAAAFDELGFSVKIDGDTAAVGAPFANGSQGKVYLFTRSGTAWSAQTMLTADDGAASDRYGLALALDGDTLAIGSPSAEVGGNSDQGAVYLYARSGGDWSYQAKINAEDGAPFDEFGVSVSLDGNDIIAGAHYADIGSIPGQGAAYVFTRSGTDWTQQAKLSSSDGWFGDEFGFSVGISAGHAIVGALFANPNGNENQGEAYIFTRSGSDWTQETPLISDGASGDEFGIGVAIDHGTAVVGAEYGTVDGDWRGAAYVYSSGGDGVCANPIVENFDGVTVPALPAGWTFTAAAGTGPWETVSDAADTAPNAAHAPDQSSPSDLYLDSPVFVPQEGSTLSFRHRYDFEPTYDGAVLEISIDGAPFTDIVAADGSFVDGAYSDTMQGSSAIAGRQAWTGNSAGAFITTTVTYPPSAIGAPVQLRWRAVSDVTVGLTGWWVDTITLGCNDGAPPVPHAEISPASFDFALAPGTMATDTLTIANIGDAGSALDFSIDEAGADCNVPADIPWLSVDVAKGDVAAGSSQDVIVTADASSLDDGNYSALLCVASNDADQALVPVAITLTVSGQNPDVIFADGFDGN